MSLSPGARELALAAEAIGVSLSQDQAAMLAGFESLLRNRALGLGLVAEGDRGRIRERHVLDSLRAAAVVAQADRHAYDLGSGAGLPGIVVAVARPAVRLTLVEARLRGVAFIELALTELGLSNAQVVHARIEEMTDPTDLCFARALGPLEVSWGAASRLLRSRGRLVYFAGRGARLPDDLLPGASSCLRVEPLLESSGPLVIMTRQ